MTYDDAEELGIPRRRPGFEALLRRASSV